MHPLSSNDPLAQLVEHNTFNVGVLGSNPKRITSRRESAMVLFFCFGICIGTVTSELIAVIGILITTENLDSKVQKNPQMPKLSLDYLRLFTYIFQFPTKT